MTFYAALDVAAPTAAICIVGQEGTIRLARSVRAKLLLLAGAIDPIQPVASVCCGTAPSRRRWPANAMSANPCGQRLVHKYLIDVKHAVIMDIAASPALRTAEVNAAKAMIDRVEGRFGMKPKHSASTPRSVTTVQTHDAGFNARRSSPQERCPIARQT
jgi:hypothetical protein